MQAILSAFKENDSFLKLKKSLTNGNYPVHVADMDKRVIPLVMEALLDEPAVRLIVTYDERRARQIVEDYRFYNRNVYYYPAKDALFYYADVHSNATAKGRIEVFKSLAEGEKAVIVTTIDGLMDKIPPLSDLIENAIVLKKEESLNIGKISDRLVTLGYENVYMVEAPGQFSVRGGILDIFPLTEECPYRVELWGDDIDSIRSFDVESQRSIEETECVTVYPAAEMVLTIDRIDKGLKKIKAEHEEQARQLKSSFRTESYARLNKLVASIKEELKEFNSTMGIDSLVSFFYDETVSFLDYIPEDAYIYVDEPEKIVRHARAYITEFSESMASRLEGGYVLPSQTEILFDGKEIIGRLANKRLVMFSEIYKKQPLWNEKCDITIESKSLIGYENNIKKLEEDIAGWRKKNYKVVVISPSATRGKRIAGNLREDGIESYFSEDKNRTLAQKEVFVTLGRLESGFEIADSKLVVISESDIFTVGEYKKKRKKPKYSGEKISGFGDIMVGDYVVHENHGVGIYRGIEKVEQSGRVKDYIAIEYAKGSKLFVPVEQLDRIGKLSGKEGARPPKINNLGGNDWEKVRSRVKGKIDDIAQELIDLYAIRETSKGFEYSKDNSWQREFEELFPYEETADQRKAIEDTKRDMESGKIMDRLICGDVGFGKTEVAIRAAFKAVQDNKQVAYLVPTTILAEQHFENFVERMKDYPVNISMLSRFCTPKQVKDILQKMKEGKTDIVIGTHRLLSKDIEFKNLGLLIIDEEQRFGVKHKEQIKQLKKNVDVLTLTATPIPRTLHMSMVGLRDISLLEEPPIDRMPIQTYVMEYDIEFVKEACGRELARNGQVYYVYNRVDNIDQVTADLRTVLPNARIEFAHGKMNERELESIMHSFIKHEIDVLVSTTIIETGLDIPNVNTIIIHGADRFGLSQLYQLRGRVGRSSRSSYAFLMYQRDKILSEVAEKRLKAIREFTDLGSGYKISMRDLEIRGAGNLLGQEQSGNIEAVGYDLYCKMLSDAIKRLSGEKTETEFVTSIELPVDANIPDNYVKNEFMKLDLYKRISKCSNREDNDAIIEEARDRFGEPPKQFMRLLDIAYLKALAHRAYITDIKYINNELVFFVLNKAPIKVERIDKLLKKYKGRLKLITGEKSGFKIAASKTIQEEMLEIVEQIINEINMLME